MEEARGLWGDDAQMVSQDMMSLRFSSSDQDVCTFDLKNNNNNNEQQHMPNRKRGKLQRQQNQAARAQKKQKHQLRQTQPLTTSNSESSTSSALDLQQQLRNDFFTRFSSAGQNPGTFDTPPSLGWTPSNSASHDDRRGAIKFVSAGIASFNTLSNRTQNDDDDMMDTEISSALFTQHTSVPSGMEITNEANDEHDRHTTSSKARPMHVRQKRNQSDRKPASTPPANTLPATAIDLPQSSTTESLQYSSDDERSGNDEARPKQPQQLQHNTTPASEFMNVDLLALDPIVESDEDSENSDDESAESSDETDSDEAVDEWEDVGEKVVSTSSDNETADHRESSPAPSAPLRMFKFDDNMTKAEIRERLMQVLHPDLMHRDLMIQWALLYLKPPDPSSREYAPGTFAFANRTPPSYFKQVMTQLCSGKSNPQMPPMDHEFRSHIHVLYHNEGGNCHSKGKEAKLVLRQGMREPDAFSNRDRHIVLTRPPPKKISMSEYEINQHIEELEENIRELEERARVLVTKGLMFVDPVERAKLKRKKQRELQKKLKKNTVSKAMQRLQSAAPISSSNIGYQLLMAHGWKEGSGIGRQTGDTSVVIPVTTVGRRGLGHRR